MRRLVAGALLAAGCVTPLSNRIEVGDEAFVVVVGEGADGNTDLFAAPAEGGTFRQLTYSRVLEDIPRLDSTGTRLAFVRARRVGAADSSTVVVMNLKLGTEVEGDVPAEAGAPVKLGWTGDTVVMATSAGVWTAEAGRPLEWIRAADAALPALDSILSERIGKPVFATVATCSGGTGFCVRTGAGEETALDPRATDPIRWGPDGIGYLVDGRIEIRPLGGGRLRQPTFNAAPANLRHPTHHPGSDTR